VTNVRVAIAYLFVDWGSDQLPPWNTNDNDNELIAKSNSWHWLLRRPDIKECVFRLSRDDNDVYLNLIKLQPLFPDMKFSSVSCRGRKEPPGGVKPINSNPVGSSFADDSSVTICTNADIELNLGVVAEQITADSEIIHSDSSFCKPIHSAIDMSAIDINALPRARAASFTNKEFIVETKESSPAALEEELDIIDGIIKASPKNFNSGSHNMQTDMDGVETESRSRVNQNSILGDDFMQSDYCDVPVEIDDELDLIDGIVKSAPNHSHIGRTIISPAKQVSSDVSSDSAAVIMEDI